MKKLYTGVLFVSLFFFPRCLFSQLNNGGLSANFGIDGDTRANYVKYGPATGLIPSDDWFSYVAGAISVIDTSNASFYLSLLSGGANLGFNKRMSVPLYSKISGKLWLDAVYGRDFISTSPLFDSTIFTIAAKNGDNPTNWLGGISNIPDKNDLLDVYAHMRRDGTSVYDSLWLFTGVSTVGTSGSRYFDAELYKKNFSYNSVSGTFSTAGTDAGHTAWQFDASGNITSTGDMILAVNYTPGMPPVVDLRIWVSQTTFSTIVPARFNFGPVLDGATAAFGYVSILSKTGATAFGSGIANYSATATADTTESTPWGTEQSSKNWGTQYQTLQLIEIGLNLTRIGLDPALYTAQGLNPCTSLFSDIFFKSRSSNSFTSNMQDFVEPLTFLRPPVMDFNLQPDTLRCNKPSGTIQITNVSTVGYYTWQTLSGNISGSNADSSQVNINKPGTYVVSGSPAIGCPATRIDTVIIPLDTFPPVASINATVGPNYSYLQLFGGDVAASNYMTPFGGSQGLLFDWSGPNSFTSTLQNPVTDTAWGNYQLIVTEKRNGCKDTVVKPLSIWDFIVLAGRFMNLSGNYESNFVLLNWQNIPQSNTQYYIIERSADGRNFSPIASIDNSSSPDTVYSMLSYKDMNPSKGVNYYRIQSVSADGKTLYSNIIEISTDPSQNRKIYLVTASGGKQAAIVCISDKDCQGTVVIYDMLGRPLSSKSMHLNAGTNIIPLSLSNELRKGVIVISLYLNNKMAFSQEAAF